MLRTCICGLVFSLFFVVTLPLVPVLALIGRRNPALKDDIYLKMGRWLSRVTLRLAGTQITTIGTENIPDDRAVLFICNHRSIFDILINYAYMKEPIGMISKKEIAKIPLLRLWMKNIGCLFLDRDDLKQGLRTILTAIDYVKNGRSILIYPEGTRNKTEDDMLPFKAGSFKIALKSKCDVIPVTIVNSAEIYENHKPDIRKTHVIIEYGKPIKVGEMDKQETARLPENVHDIILATYRKNKEAI